MTWCSGDFLIDYIKDLDWYQEFILFVGAIRRVALLICLFIFAVNSYCTRKTTDVVRNIIIHVLILNEGAAFPCPIK